MEEQRHRPVLLGLAGDSAAGKTTLAGGIAETLGRDRVLVLCTDDYRRWEREERDRRGMTALDPAANHLDVLRQDLERLRTRQPILKPVYDHHAGCRTRPEYFHAGPGVRFILVEGALALSDRDLRDLFDVKIFLEPEDALRVAWKQAHDSRERGRDEATVRERLARREPDAAHHVRPQRALADMVVRFHRPADDLAETGAHLDAEVVLRPTLPHPDLTPLVTAGLRSGIHLNLGRDIDGKPVDVLEIAGSILDQDAQAMEDLLWSLIPRSSGMHERVGRFRDGGDSLSLSHPLALVQLLCAYHAAKAEQGIYAV